MARLFSIWFCALALIYSVLTIPALTLGVTLARPFIGRRGAFRLFRRCIAIWGRGIVSILPWPFIRVNYRDLSDGKVSGPFVVVCNHRSASDPFLMSLLGIDGIQVVNIWPFKIPVLGWYARRAGYLSVREMPYDVFEQRVVACLKDGISIVAFPEGTRSGSRRMGQFHGALFRACLTTHATIVPICIAGTEDKPARGTLRFQPGPIAMHRLPSIPFEAYRHMTPFAFKNHVRDTIDAHLQTME